MSRNKGKSAERELARLLTAEGFPAVRGVQYHGGADSPDIRCPCLPGIHFEVKRTERLRLYDALAQAKHDAGEKLPIVAHRANNCDWVAILPMANLLAIVRASDYCKPDEQAIDAAAVLTHINTLQADEAQEYVTQLATEDPRTFFTLLAETMEDDEDG